MEQYFQANQKMWDEKTPIHLQSEMYDLENFIKGKTSLNDIEIEGLGEVAGKKILHLQCHFGQDSLSWARKGASVTGVDFSKEAIKTARNLNEKLGLSVDFIESNILDLKENLSSAGAYDIVFTSYGTICWLPDIEKWASIIHHFLQPNGIFYIADFHPILNMFEWDSHRLQYPYFNRGVHSDVVEGTYADPNANLRHEEYFWLHPLSDVFQALMKHGLQVIDFQEFDYSPYNCFPNMEEVSEGKYVYFPSTEYADRVRLPHVYSLKMKKP